MKASGVAGIGPAVVDGEGGASGGVKAARGVTSAALVVFRGVGGARVTSEVTVCIQVVANEMSKAISNESSYESHM
jgi:hypothetical protein